jgi:hypothetical protein
MMMTTMMRRPLACALLLGSAGCLREPDPFEYAEPSLSVHGLVRMGETEVAVSILRGVGEAGPGATVTLDDGTTTVTLARAANDSACFSPYGAFDPALAVGCFTAPLAAPIAPGSRWRLDADVQPDYTVTGTTAVPALPTIVRPLARERITYHPPSGEPAVSFTVEWQTAAAPRVLVRVGEGSAYHGGNRLPGVRCVFPQLGEVEDAAIGQPSGSRRIDVLDVLCATPTASLAQWDSVVTEVMVTAFDSAYAEFALHGESVTRARPGAALQGAYGVFGSAATAKREIVIVH